MTDQSTSRALTLPQELANKRPQFQAALPPHISPDKFVRVLMTAVQMDHKLVNADRQSLWTACMKAAADGLLPDGREGALTIYSTKTSDGWIDKVAWMPMIGGIRKKVRNSGEITTWEVETVYEKDEFYYEKGDNPHLKHVPFLDGDAGQARLFYSIARLKGGEVSFDVMPRSKVEEVRDKYAKKNKDGKFSPAWEKSFDEMGKKTVARRHSKVLPMSTDLEALITRDDEMYDVRGNSSEPAAPRKSLSEKLDLLAGDGYNAETGEITETAVSTIPTDPQPGEDDSAAPPPSSPPTADVSPMPASAQAGASSPSNLEAPAADPAKAALHAKGLSFAAKGIAVLHMWADEEMTAEENALMTPEMWNIWTSEAKAIDAGKKAKK